MRLRVSRYVVVALLAAMGPATAQPVLGPFKDDLFRYPQPVASQDGRAFLDVPYDEARDIDRRDEIPERRVRRAYVDMSAGSAAETVLDTSAGPVHVATLGRADGASFVVVFMHGRNGDRRLGMNDWTFGGNFNRLKNLVARGGGLYATIDGGALNETDAKRFADAVVQLADRSPGAPLVLACGSMGGLLCWQAMREPALARRVAGLVLLSSRSSEDTLDRAETARGGRALPMLLAQGSRDRVYPLDEQRRFYEAVRRAGRHPIRLVAFEGGNHGTPIRMIDWRDTLNWMLSRH